MGNVISVSFFLNSSFNSISCVTYRSSYALSSKLTNNIKLLLEFSSFCLNRDIACEIFSYVEDQFFWIQELMLNL